MASSFQPKISYSMSMQKQGSRKSGDRPTSVLTVWSGPAVPADALDLTGGEEEAAVLAVAAGAADTATAWAPAPVPQVPVVAQGARLAGVAGVAGRAAALLRPAHQRAARQLRHRNVQHDLAEEGLRRGGRDRSPNQDGLRGETNLLQFFHTTYRGFSIFILKPYGLK